ncbi:MAG: helix-turn-helix transcriptional regulator [Candidatus Peribacteraceae bacterium]|nr:helix-turn-helix transcriptional regulator [Candidatus Peribacteraceae bacterium]
MAHEDIRVKFGKRLRKLRAEHELKQRELAQKAGISLPYVQMLEAIKPKKRKNVTIVTLEKLASAFEMSLSELLDF